MMDLIITIIFLMFLFVINHFIFKDVLCPSFLVLGTIIVILCFYVASFSIWPEQDYFETCKLISASCLSFFGGALLARRFKIGIHVRKAQCISCRIDMSMNNKVLFLLGIIIIITAIWGGGYEYATSKIYREAESFSQQLHENNFFMDVLIQILYGTTYVIEYSLIMDLIYNKTKKKSLIKFLLIIPMNCVCVFCGSRFPLFIELMYVLSVSNIAYRYRNGKNNYKMMTTALKVFSGVVVAFILAGYAASKINKDRSIFLLLLKYLTVGIYGLTNYISGFTYNPNEFGAISFNNIYRALNILGLNLNFRYSAISKHYYINSTMGTANLYTSFMNFLSDFNICGSIIVMFALGWFVTKVYMSIINKRHQDLKPWIIIYSCAFYLCVALWIEQNPINMLLSSSFIVRSIIIVLECKAILFIQRDNEHQIIIDEKYML